MTPPGCVGGPSAALRAADTAQREPCSTSLAALRLPKSRGHDPWEDPTPKSRSAAHAGSRHSPSLRSTAHSMTRWPPTQPKLCSTAHSKCGHGPWPRSAPPVGRQHSPSLRSTAQAGCGHGPPPRSASRCGHGS